MTKKKIEFTLTQLFGDKCLPDKTPSNVSDNETKGETKEYRNLSQETANCDKSKRKALYDALCELESASVKVRKALAAF